MVASQLNDHIIKALKIFESLSTDPDFVPIGFFGKDKAVTRIPDTQESSYYNLVLGNVIDTGILDQQRENRVFRYLDLRTGLSMGMPRTRPFWKNSPYYGQDGIAPLYGLKYAQARLRRDQPDHAIVTLYGWLAHGMTRDSCIHGEGVRYSGGDANGRFFSSSAQFHIRSKLAHTSSFPHDSGMGSRSQRPIRNPPTTRRHTKTMAL